LSDRNRLQKFTPSHTILQNRVRCREAHLPPLYSDVKIYRIRRTISVVCEGMFYTSAILATRHAASPTTLCHLHRPYHHTCAREFPHVPDEPRTTAPKMRAATKGCPATTVVRVGFTQRCLVVALEWRVEGRIAKVSWFGMDVAKSCITSRLLGTLLIKWDHAYPYDNTSHNNRHPSSVLTSNITKYAPNVGEVLHFRCDVYPRRGRVASASAHVHRHGLT
jgi:hypothetical protein